MPVLIDSSQLTRNFTNYRVAFENDSKQIRDGIKHGLNKAVDAIMADVRSNPETPRQVGFDVEQFEANIRPIYPTGRNSYGIFDTDVVGDAEDVEEIFGIPGLWHMGTGRFDIFEARVLGNADRKEMVSEGRQEYWHPRTPQWIFINYGFEAVMMGGVVADEFEDSVFIVEQAPSNFIQKGKRVARDTARFAVQTNLENVFRGAGGRFITNPTPTTLGRSTPLADV